MRRASLGALLSSAVLGLMLSTIAVGGTFYAGDIAPRGNPDGVIDEADVLLLQRILLGEITPTADKNKLSMWLPSGIPTGY